MLSILGQDGTPVIRDPGSIGQGITLACACNLGALLLGLALIVVSVGVPIVAGFGLLQFVWIVPLYGNYRASGETETAKGILIAAGLTVLLSAGCWGFIVFPTWRP